MARIVGAVGLKVKPDTSRFKREADKELRAVDLKEVKAPIRPDSDRLSVETNRAIRDENKRLRETDTSIKVPVTVDGDKITEQAKRAVRSAQRAIKSAGLSIKIPLAIDTSKVADDISKGIDKALTKIRERGDLEVVLRVKVDLTRADNDLDHFVRHNDGRNVKLDVALDRNARIYAELAVLARDRNVKVKPTLDKKAYASVLKSLAALSGLNVVKDFSKSLRNMAQNADRFALSAAKIGTAIGGLGTIGFAGFGGLSVIAGGLAQLGGAALALPAAAVAMGSFIAVGVAGFKNFGAAVKGNNEAMALLPENAQKAAQALQGTWTQIQRPTQDSFWTGVGASFERSIGPIVDRLETGLSQVGLQSGRALGNTLSGVRDIAESGILEQMFDGIAGGLKNANRGMAPFMRALGTLANEASGNLPAVGGYLADISTKFERWINAAAYTGRMDAWLRNAFTRLGQIKDLFGDLVGGFSAINAAARRAGFGGMDTLVAQADKFRAVLESFPAQAALTTLFSGAKDGMDEFKNGLRPLGRALADFAPVLADLFRSSGRVIGSLARSVGRVLDDPTFRAGVDTFFSAIASGLQALESSAPAVGRLLGGVLSVSGKLFETLTPVLADIVKLMAEAVERLAPAIESLSKSMSGALRSGLAFMAALLPPIASALGIFADVIEKIPSPLLGMAAALLLFNRAMNGGLFARIKKLSGAIGALGATPPTFAPYALSGSQISNATTSFRRVGEQVGTAFSSGFAATSAAAAPAFTAAAATSSTYRMAGTTAGTNFVAGVVSVVAKAGSALVPAKGGALTVYRGLGQVAGVDFSAAYTQAVLAYLANLPRAIGAAASGMAVPGEAAGRVFANAFLGAFLAYLRTLPLAITSSAGSMIAAGSAMGSSSGAAFALSFKAAAAAGLLGAGGVPAALTAARAPLQLTAGTVGASTGTSFAGRMMGSIRSGMNSIRSTVSNALAPLGGASGLGLLAGITLVTTAISKQSQAAQANADNLQRAVDNARELAKIKIANPLADGPTQGELDKANSEADRILDLTSKFAEVPAELRGALGSNRQGLIDIYLGKNDTAAAKEALGLLQQLNDVAVSRKVSGSPFDVFMNTDSADQLPGVIDNYLKAAGAVDEFKKQALGTDSGKVEQNLAVMTGALTKFGEVTPQSLDKAAVAITDFSGKPLKGIEAFAVGIASNLGGTKDEIHKYAVGLTAGMRELGTSPQALVQIATQMGVPADQIEKMLSQLGITGEQAAQDMKFAFGGVKDGLGNLVTVAGQTLPKISPFSDGLTELGDAVSGLTNVDSSTLTHVFRTMGTDALSVAQGLTAAGVSAADITTVLAAMDKPASDAASALQAVTVAQQNMAKTSLTEGGWNTIAAVAFGKALEQIGRSADGAAQKADALRQAIDQLNGGQLSSEQATSDLYAALDNTKAVLDGLGGSVVQGDGSIKKIAVTAADFAKVMNLTTGEIDKSTEAGRNLFGSLTDLSTKALTSASTEFDRVYKSTGDYGLAAEAATKATEGQTASLEGLLKKAGLTQGQIDTLLARYNLVPDKITTDLIATTAAATTPIGGVLGLLNNFENPRNVKLGALPDGADQVLKGLGIKLTKYADGTYSADLGADDAAARGKVDDLAAWIQGQSFNGVVDFNKWTNSLGTIEVAATAVVQRVSGVSGARINADGNLLEGPRLIAKAFANGGIERHIAHIARSTAQTPVRIFAEPETGGEAYIPLALSKRDRSEQILRQVASEFGMQLISKDRQARQFVNGGIEGGSPSTTVLGNGPTFNITNHYPQAEPTSVTAARAGALVGAIGEY